MILKIKEREEKLMREETRYKNSLKSIRNMFISIVCLAVAVAILIGWTGQAETYSQENVAIQQARRNQDIRYRLKQGWITEEEARSLRGE